MTPDHPEIKILVADQWKDYRLLDSGGGLRLEQYGPYRFIRPAAQAVWNPGLTDKEWQNRDGVFEAKHEEKGGQWTFTRPQHVPDWKMSYRNLHFQVFTANSRHMGVFPEQAPHWDWLIHTIQKEEKPLKILNLFGYTGLASLAAASAGAKVTHVDASKKSIQIAHANQALSQISEDHIRWIVDDALKFVNREQRRGERYEGIILDPPKFGRGPKGEVWEFFDLLPRLLEGCRSILSPKPLLFLMTAYSIQASPLSLYNTLLPIFKEFGGVLECGELTIREASLGRLLPMAIFVRWSSS